MAPMRRTGGGSSSDRYTQLMKALYQVKIEGRPIVELFLEIPDASIYPDYPKVVTHPISLAEVSKRVRNNSYTSDDAFLDDLELMAENARTYNGDESPVFDDAVDILDFALLWVGREPSKYSRKQLQLQVLSDLENYKSKGRRLSDAFQQEPDAKTYPNYRDVVKIPSSFTKVRNQIEKGGPFGNWAEATQEIGRMFDNAILYNQEGSLIYNDAKTLLKQLHSKVNKYSQVPRHLEIALPANTRKAIEDREGSNDSDDVASAGRGRSSGTIVDSDDSDASARDSDMDDDDESEEDSDDDRSARRRPAANRYHDDDDDDDFEADSEDVDEEDMANGDVDGTENGGTDMMGNGSGVNLDSVPIGVDPRNFIPPYMQPAEVYDELVYRPPDEDVTNALLRLVTVNSLPFAPNMAPIEDVKRSENDVVQLRFPPSPTKAFTTFATTLPYHQSSLRLEVFPNRKVDPIQTVVLLNGAKLQASLNQMSQSIPGQSLAQSYHDTYEFSLSPGLNQVTVIAIKSTYGGYIRQYGPPPLAEAESDEERLVLFLNLSK